jgi:CHAD domain-containing protein
MGPSGKWLDGINPDASVIDAARRSLSARLTAVAHWLPLAAYHATQDVEHVHRLRVSTRRAVAALRMYRDCLPPKTFRWVKRRLKKIRRAAGEARDLDVLAQRFERDGGERMAPVLCIVKDRRAAAQPAIIEIAEKCRRADRFVRKIGNLLDGIRLPEVGTQNGQPQTFREWARTQLTCMADAFLVDMPIGSHDPADLHQFRIRGKAVRYGIELLAPAFQPDLRSECYPIVEELQERLGAINDHVIAVGRLSQWREEVDDPSLDALWTELIESERGSIARLIENFHHWWTPELIEALQVGLSRAVQSETVESG